VSRAEDGGGERVSSEITARSISTLRRSVGSPLLFAIVYTPLASALYFCLGVIAGRALGLTPLVFVISSLLFALTAMTYAEGASMHPERSGSTVFARYAFNELISFVAGWAILLDYIILIAVTTYSATQYLSVFSSPLGDRDEALILALLFIAVVVVGNVRGLGGRRARRIGVLVIADLALQVFIVILGLALFFNSDKLFDPIHLGIAPKWSDFVFALTVAAISFTSLESAAGVAGEVRVSSAALKRLIASGTVTVVLIYTGIEWALIIGSYYTLFLAFPATASFEFTDVVVFLGFVSFGSIVQIPGIGGGIQVVSIVVLTQIYGLKLESATGLALFLWIVTFVVIVPIGLACAFHQGLNWSKLKHLSDEIPL